MQVVLNTASISTKIKSIVVNNSAKVGSILNQVSKKQLNPKKFEFLILKENFMASPYSMKDNDGDLGFDGQGGGLENDEDERIIDHETIVRNLKSSRIELREKLFVDKSIRKWLGVTMEEKASGNPNVNIMNRQNTKGYFSNDMIAMARNFNQTYQGDRARLDSDHEQFANYDEEEMKQNGTQFKKEEDFLYG